MRNYTFLIYAVLWLLLIASSYYQRVVASKDDAQEIAAKQAELLFANIESLQQWSALHAAVHEPIPPMLPEQGSETAIDGRFAVGHPPCADREFADLMARKTGIRFRLFSLKPLRTENIADAWEKSALDSFAKGEASRRGQAVHDGKLYYRFAKPLVFTDGCSKCHAPEMSGTFAGMQADVPASSINAMTGRQLLHSGITHLVIALVGLAALWIAYYFNRKMARRLDKAKRHLQLAYLDVLTQLPNRRYYDFFVNREWKRAMRQGYPLSMIMIDIDHFKSYNDTLGHIKGDQCLQQVARTLRMYFRRAGDLIARYGGEEFCVVAACDADQIKQLAEILRKAIEDMQLPHPGSKTSAFVTISLGTATVIPAEPMKFEELLRFADQTLYLAKKNGRNRVESYRPIPNSSNLETDDNR